MDSARYEHTGLIAVEGGIELRRLRDHHLGRLLWMWTPSAELRPDASLAAGLLHHGRISGALRLPGVQAVYELGHDEHGRPFVVVGPAEGLSFRDRCRLLGGARSAGAVAIEPLVRALVRTSRLVEAAHEQGVMHGSLGPSVVRVTDHGQIWLTGWERGVRHDGPVGQGRPVEVPGPWATGLLPRDPTSTRPELLLGHETEARRVSDVYGLGTLLYELLTGVPPYAHHTGAELGHAIRTGAPGEPHAQLQTAPAGVETWPESLGEMGQIDRTDTLVALCLEAMAWDPRDRVESAAAFAAALEGWLRGGTTTVASTPTSHQGDVEPMGGAGFEEWGLAEGPGRHRYEDLGLIATGGMAEVRRVRDRALDRILAMKIILPALQEHPPSVARFATEAWLTARLDHPGVVPVHDVGWCADGRPFFTMKEVRGRSLHDVLVDVHAVSHRDPWAPIAEGWNLRRLVDAFRAMCQAVAYAHEREIIHRDLKPANVMVGDFGEVLVMDWGLARELQAARLDPPERVGTPAYVSPEQARSSVEAAHPTADVYTLGATLYHLLGGRLPYGGLTDGYAMIEAVKAGPPEPLERVHTSRHPSAAPLPPALLRLVADCMARGPADRPQTAGEVADRVAAWLDGAERRSRALAEIARARARGPRVTRLRDEARSLQQEAAEELDLVPPYAPVGAKQRGWALQDRAAALLQRAEVVDAEVTQLIQGALSHAPELDQAHALLASRYQRAHVEAEAARDVGRAARLEVSLRAHDRGRFGPYLSGEGALTLRTDPPGAEVTLFAWSQVARRLQPEPVRALGRTPLIDLSLPMGSYLLVIRAPGRHEVRYPVHITRNAHWDGVPPHESESLPVWLPFEGELALDEVYVPAGWTWVGGDEAAPNALRRRRVWVDAFSMRRTPLTMGEWRRYIDQTEATRPSNPQDPAVAWPETWPAVMMSWHEALGYAAWASEETGRDWRLPAELEREKAARGVDGRHFPWGDHFDPTLCCMGDSRPDEPAPSPVDGFPSDRSPYGALGFAGNVREWCLDMYRREGGTADGERVAVPTPGLDPAGDRVLRGGAWNNAGVYCRAAYRYGFAPTFRFHSVGMRLYRSLAERG